MKQEPRWRRLLRPRRLGQRQLLLEQQLIRLERNRPRTTVLLLLQREQEPGREFQPEQVFQPGQGRQKKPQQEQLRDKSQKMGQQQLERFLQKERGFQQGLEKRPEPFHNCQRFQPRRRPLQ